MALKKNLGKEYSPTLFLASLGNGGMAVAFYVYLHFMVKHMNFVAEGHDKQVKIPMAEFGAVKQALTGGDLLTSILVGVALLGIVVFAARHYFFLFWNLSELKKFKQTSAYQELLNSNREISLAAIPLTLAMSINVLFVVAAVFTPGLWNFVEYLFPGALLGFLLVGIYATKIFVIFMTRVLSSGDFDCSQNNSLSMMIAVFAFSMVAVGFAAPGAMSNTLVTSALGIIGSMFFLSATILLGLLTARHQQRKQPHHVDRDSHPDLDRHQHGTRRSWSAHEPERAHAIRRNVRQLVLSHFPAGVVRRDGVVRHEAGEVFRGIHQRRQSKPYQLCTHLSRGSVFCVWNVYPAHGSGAHGGGFQVRHCLLDSAGGADLYSGKNHHYDLQTG